MLFLLWNGTSLVNPVTGGRTLLGGSTRTHECVTRIHPRINKLPPIEFYCSLERKNNRRSGLQIPRKTSIHPSLPPSIHPSIQRQVQPGVSGLSAAHQSLTFADLHPVFLLEKALSFPVFLV